MYVTKTIFFNKKNTLLAPYPPQLEKTIMVTSLGFNRSQPVNTTELWRRGTNKMSTMNTILT